MMVGRLLSYWEGNFSGAMSNFGRVSNDIYPTRSSKICQIARPLVEERLAKPPKKHRNDLEKKNTPNNPSVGPISCGACPEVQGGPRIQL